MKTWAKICIILILAAVYATITVYFPSWEIQLMLSSTRFHRYSSFRRNLGFEASLPINLAANWTNSAKEDGCFHLSPGNPSPMYPQVLEKKQLNKNIRFVFTLGLEGSGHHFIGPMLHGSPNVRCLPKPTRFNHYGTTLVHHRMKEGLFGYQNNLGTVVHELEEYMGWIQEVVDNTEDGAQVTYAINTVCGMSVGEYSYPNGNHGCRETNFPDVRIMAEVFEALGLDFRVMVLYRNALDVLISTAGHRYFGLLEGGWNGLARLYTTIVDEYILPEQLERLDPRFIMCLKYDDLPALPANFSSFFNLDAENKPFRVRNFHQSDPTEKEAEREKYRLRDIENNYKTLERSLQRVLKICDHSDEVRN